MDIPILQMRRMRLSKGKSLAQGPTGRFESGQPDSSPQGCTTWLCAWLHGGILLYYFPGALLIVRTKRLSTSFIYGPMSNCPDRGTSDSKPPSLIVFPAQLVPRYLWFCGCLNFCSLPALLLIILTP